MSDRRLDPLDDEIDKLLAAERDRPAPPPELRTRVIQRLGAPLGPIPDLSSGVRPAQPPAPVPVASPSLLGAPLVAGLIAGGVVAAVIALGGPEPRPVAVVTATAAPPAITASVREPPPEPAPVLVDAGAPPPAPRATASARDEGLAAERALLDEAQRALSAGRSADALELVGRHAAEHPRGRLGEEREGLWIRALIAAGRSDEARVRAERFKRSHPRSLLLPALEAAVGPIP